MILEGAKLMAVGMAIVYVFLLVLMLSVILSAKLFKDSGAKVSSDAGGSAKSRKNVLPVIAAAVAAYRAKHAGDG